MMDNENAVIEEEKDTAPTPASAGNVAGTAQETVSGTGLADAPGRNAGDRAAKQRKTGTLVSAYIEQKAYEALRRHCEVTGQSKTKAIERAILSYCKDDSQE